MLVLRCTQKCRDSKGKITGYTLIDQNGMSKYIEASKLKSAIVNKQVTVVNLTLTSDGRLIEKKADMNNQESSESKFMRRFDEAVDKFISEIDKSHSAQSEEYDLSDEDDLYNAYFGTKIIGGYSNKGRKKQFKITVEVKSSYSRKEANVYLIDSNNDDVEFAESVILEHPLYSNENLRRIRSMLDMFAGRFKNWLQSKNN